MRKLISSVVLSLVIFMLGACSQGNPSSLTEDLKKSAAEAVFLAAIGDPYFDMDVKPIKIIYLNYKFSKSVEIKSAEGVKYKAYPVYAEGEGYFKFSYNKWAKAKAHGYLYKDEFGNNRIKLKDHEREEWPIKGSMAQDIARRFSGLASDSPTKYSELP